MQGLLVQIIKVNKIFVLLSNWSMPIGVLVINMILWLMKIKKKKTRDKEL
jgi:cytochrome c-type biogenesis protein CcmH/NrfF